PAARSPFSAPPAPPTPLPDRVIGTIDPAQHARLWRRHFEIDLVRLELDQRVARRHDVPLLLQPLRHARVDNRFAYLRNDDIRWHISPIPQPVQARASTHALDVPATSTPRRPLR